jgi:SAM-dependent methyltransferase
VTTFAALYADAYDALYEAKDYEGEVARLERDFDLDGQVARVLDLGCGTGRHAALLSRGYDVVGVDQSADLLARARRRAPWARFVEADLRSFELGIRFDAAVAMYAVLGYLTSNAGLLAALARTRAHLRRGGLLFFDVWYLPAVLASRPQQQFVRLPVPDVDEEVVRWTTPELDTRAGVCRLRYELIRLSGDRVVDTRVEEHAIRFFTVNELELLLDAAGFRPVRVSAYPDVGRPPDESCWYVAVLARAR